MVTVVLCQWFSPQPPKLEERPGCITELIYLQGQSTHWPRYLNPCWTSVMKNWERQVLLHYSCGNRRKQWAGRVEGKGCGKAGKSLGGEWEEWMGWKSFSLLAACMNFFSWSSYLTILPGVLSQRFGAFPVPYFSWAFAVGCCTVLWVHLSN